MNSRVPRHDSRERSHAYCLTPEIQNDMLNVAFYIPGFGNPSVVICQLTALS